LSQAKAAADAGDLEQAVKLARQSLAERHSPEGLHLLALVLAERGEEDEALVLLRQAVAEAPDYALGHLTLGLRGGGAIHFERALALVAGRRDDELLPGPDRLPVSWVRKIAQAGVKRGAAR
jgi:tetratricopeptide (TPR) repeat protein